MATLPFQWTPRTERALLLVAEDQLTDDQIAAAVGISPAGLYKWKAHPEFEARRQALVATLRAAVVQDGIANKQRRVAALQDAFDRIEQVIAARAADPTMQDVPGGKTGLLVRQVKALPGRASRAGMIEEYAVDGGTLAERRATLKQAAQEMGEWTEKRDVTSGGESLRFTISIDRATQHDADSDPDAGTAL